MFNNHLKLLFSSILTLTVFNSPLKACDVDVAINEGNAVTVCSNTPNSLTATAGYTQYIWSGVAEGSNQTAAATSNGWAYVTATDLVGCISIDSILVSVYPSTNPTISSSEGVNICPTIGGTTLSLNMMYNSIEWNDNSTSQTLFVTESGVYSVKVEDNNGCIDSAQLAINFIDFSLEALGSETVCLGSPLTLQASGGDIYAWSHGEFSPSIVVQPTEPTSYTVTIYQGACFETLTIDIDVAELPEHNMPDTILVLPGSTPIAYGAPEFDSYSWQPEEMITSTNNSSTTYTGNTSGNVTLVATNNTVGCAITHNFYFKFLELTIPEGFSPNNDGINDFFEIPEIFDFKAAIKIWNRWGDVVFESDRYTNDWDGTCKTNFCIGSDTLPEGTYFYTITIGDYKFDSFVTLKL